MPKKQSDLFDVPDESSTPIIEEVKPKKKAKKPMSDDDKKILIDRLKAGRERKKLEREGKQPPKENKTDPPPTPQPPAQNNNNNEEKENLKMQILELKNEIKSTKEKQDLIEMKNELKELKLLLSDSIKKKSDTIINKPENVKVISEPKMSRPSPPEPVIEKPRVIIPKTTILKKRFK